MASLLAGELVLELQELIPQFGLVPVRNRLYGRLSVRFRLLDQTAVRKQIPLSSSPRSWGGELDAHLFRFGLLRPMQLVLLLDELFVAASSDQHSVDSWSHCAEKMIRSEERTSFIFCSLSSRSDFSRSRAASLSTSASCAASAARADL